MVIDGARNSTHNIFTISDDLFEIVFPNETDIAFLDEVTMRIESLGVDQVAFFDQLYADPVKKKNVHGLHGTLHSTGSYCAKEYFPTRRESDVR